jgi:hypothetical protein
MNRFNQNLREAYLAVRAAGSTNTLQIVSGISSSDCLFFRFESMLVALPSLLRTG